MEDEKIYPLVIVGAGPAGLSASIFAQRAGINALVFEKLIPGGQIITSEKIENYPGFAQSISTQELISRMVKQAENLGMHLINEEVERIEKKKEKGVFTSSGKIFKTYCIIIATGAQPLSLGVRGEKELRGKGVSYCATCDAPFFRDEVVVVVGGGNRAVEEAIYLTRFAKKVYLIHRREKLRADRILQQRLFQQKKVEIVWSSVLQEICGKEEVEKVKIKNLKTEKLEDIPCRGVFIYVGTKPNTDFLKGKVKLDERGFILTSEKFETTLEGVFACGDVRANLAKQVVVACSEGAQAALMATKYLEKKGII